MPHSHGPAGDTKSPVTPRWLRVGLAVVVVVVITAIVLTWPGSSRRSTAQGSTFVHGTVVATTPTGCGSYRCADVTIRVDDGPDAGTTTSITFPPGRASDPGLQVADHVRLQRADTAGQVVYDFDDIERGRPLLVLALVFAGLVAVVARWRGVAALVGLAATFTVIVLYLLPALLDGASPVWTGTLAAAVVVLVVVPLVHGRGAKSAVALAGTLLGVGLCALLATLAVALSRLTGLSNEEVPTLIALGSPVTIGGLVLCGAVVGSIGVLNDVTITQASAVLEIAAAAPGTSRRELFRSGMRIGRDHIASTVYTLALAYTGSALPILLLLSTSGRSGVDAFTSDAVAGEIVRSLAGGIGLVLAVPVTTALAAVCAASASSAAPPLSSPPSLSAPPLLSEPLSAAPSLSSRRTRHGGKHTTP